MGKIINFTLIFIITINCSPYQPNQGGLDKSPNEEPIGTQVDQVVSNKTLDYFVLSDLNGSYGSVDYSPYVHNAVQYIISQQPKAIFITGDMVAGQKANLDYQAMWDGFHRAVTNPLRKAGISIFVTPGNHDASSYASFEHERDTYRTQWDEYKPDQGFFVDDDNYPFYYAVKIDDHLFVSLDVTRVYPGYKLPLIQLNWLKSILEKRSEYSTLTLFSHLPLVPFAQGREQDYIGDDELVDLLSDNKMTLYLSGHHHAYYPGEFRGLNLISVGCIGSGQRILIGDSQRSKASFLKVAVTQDRVKSFNAHLGQDFTNTIDMNSLPAKITINNYEINRWFLAN